METLELNIRAKPVYLETIRKQRRKDMAQWRKHKTLSFISQKSLDDWLIYTKWHKRPVKKTVDHGMIVLEFLDYKGTK